MKLKKLFIIPLVFVIISCGNLSVKEEVIVEQTDTLQLPATVLRIVNTTDSAVTVWVTLGATEGCLQHVSEIPYITDSIGNLVGSFVLAAHDSTIDYAPAKMGFNGNLSFNTQPLNCPTAQFPYGVNIYEFIVNNAYQAGNPQESVEISCVAGVNCYLSSNLYWGTDWNASSLYPKVNSFSNKGKFDNSGRIGVFPYGCDTCTGSKAPPDCAKNDKDKQKDAICIVQRNAKGSGGGLVRVCYNGGYYGG